MKRVLPTPFALLLVALASISNPTFGQTPQGGSAAADRETEALGVRVARLSLTEGDVSFLRSGTSEWAAAALNLPVFAGDQIYAGRDARAELQLSRTAHLRVGPGSTVAIAELSESVAQFEVLQGVATVRVDGLAQTFQRLEVDLPNAAVTIEQDGVYRIDVRGKDNADLVVERGLAEAATDDGTFSVREDHRLQIDTTPEGRLALVAEASRDAWDAWSFGRDAALDQAIALEPQDIGAAETANLGFYGTSDLTAYGSWTDYPSYGRCWVPRVGADWAPYRQGEWLWAPLTGWTWLPYEPWGWAPCHYGRWVLLPGIGWAWAPGFGANDVYYYDPGYYGWRPALVSFFCFSGSGSEYIGWQPLVPGERWHRPRRDHDHDHYREPGKNHSGGPGFRAGISILPVTGFVRSDRSRMHPAAPGRELGNLNDKDVHTGLPPQLRGSLAAAAPGSQGNSRRIAVPSADVLSRPIATRNQPGNSQVVTAIPRERRLLPNRPAVSGDGLQPGWRGNAGHISGAKSAFGDTGPGQPAASKERDRSHSVEPGAPDKADSANEFSRRAHRDAGSGAASNGSPIESETGRGNDRSERTPVEHSQRHEDQAPQPRHEGAAPARDRSEPNSRAAEPRHETPAAQPQQPQQHNTGSNNSSSNNSSSNNSNNGRKP